MVDCGKGELLVLWQLCICVVVVIGGVLQSIVVCSKSCWL
jgi:hypothetical protein